MLIFLCKKIQALLLFQQANDMFIHTFDSYDFVLQKSYLELICARNYNYTILKLCISAHIKASQQTGSNSELNYDHCHVHDNRVHTVH